MEQTRASLSKCVTAKLQMRNSIRYKCETSLIVYTYSNMSFKPLFQHTDMASTLWHEMGRLAVIRRLTTIWRVGRYYPHSTPDCHSNYLENSSITNQPKLPPIYLPCNKGEVTVTVEVQF